MARLQEALDAAGLKTKVIFSGKDAAHIVAVVGKIDH